MRSSAKPSNPLPVDPENVVATIGTVGRRILASGVADLQNLTGREFVHLEEPRATGHRQLATRCRNPVTLTETRQVSSPGVAVPGQRTVCSRQLATGQWHKAKGGRTVAGFAGSTRNRREPACAHAWGRCRITAVPDRRTGRSERKTRARWTVRIGTR